MDDKIISLLNTKKLRSYQIVENRPIDFEELALKYKEELLAGAPLFEYEIQTKEEFLKERRGELESEMDNTYQKFATYENIRIQTYYIKSIYRCEADLDEAAKIISNHGIIVETLRNNHAQVLVIGKRIALLFGKKNYNEEEKKIFGNALQKRARGSNEMLLIYGNKIRIHGNSWTTSVYIKFPDIKTDEGVRYWKAGLGSQASNYGCHRTLLASDSVEYISMFNDNIGVCVDKKFVPAQIDNEHILSLICFKTWVHLVVMHFNNKIFYLIDAFFVGYVDLQMEFDFINAIGNVAVGGRPFDVPFADLKIYNTSKEPNEISLHYFNAPLKTVQKNKLRPKELIPSAKYKTKK